MDFNSLFRKFFHLNPGNTRDPFLPYDNLRSDDTDDQVLKDNFEIFDSHIDMFKQMEDLFSSMFSPSFGVIGFPNFEEDLPSQGKNHENPRRAMINDPDDEEFSDSSSNRRSFGALMFPSFEEPGREPLEKRRLFSYSKFSSVKTVHLPDGTVEEHRTVIDDNGNKTSTVRRTIGDTSHEVTTKSDKQGIKEKEENFLNLDENELSSFEQKWNKLKGGDSVTPEVPSLSLPDSNPSYLHILKKFFGPSSKEELKWI